MTPHATRPKSGYAKKLCYQIEEDARKQNYDLLQMQEEKYGLQGGHPTDLTVVYDVHKEEADKEFAGIVARPLYMCVENYAGLFPLCQN